LHNKISGGGKKREREHQDESVGGRKNSTKGTSKVGVKIDGEKRI